jgi:hypothetical protein
MVLPIIISHQFLHVAPCVQIQHLTFPLEFIQFHMQMEDHKTWRIQCMGQKANSC